MGLRLLAAIDAKNQSFDASFISIKNSVLNEVLMRVGQTFIESFMFKRLKSIPKLDYFLNQG
jgi:hypothetical protein